MTVGRKRKVFIKLRLGMVRRRIFKIFDSTITEQKIRRLRRLSHRDFVFLFQNIGLRLALAYAENPQAPKWKRLGTFRLGTFRIRVKTYIKYNEGRSTMG